MGFPVIGIFELLILIVIGAVIGRLIFSGKRAAGNSPSPKSIPGDVNLPCPHCGQQTPASAVECEHCQAPLAGGR